MKKSKKITAYLLAVCAISSCLSFSGCLTTTYISLSCRGMLERMEIERKQRQEALDNVANETNLSYWIVDTGEAQKITANNERQFTMFIHSANDALNSGKNNCYNVTARDTHAFYLYVTDMKSNRSSDGVDNGKNYTKYDVALLKMDYATGVSTVLYTFDDVFCYLGTGSPDLYRIADENHAVLYENGWVKVLNVTTKQITYEKQLFHDENEYHENNIYASSSGRFGFYAEWSDFVLDNVYYEYCDGGFVEHALPWAGLKDANVGRYENELGYLERLGSVVYEDIQDRAFDLTTDTEIDFETFIERKSAEKISQKNARFYSFQRDGETYWYSPSYAGVYQKNSETKQLEPLKELTYEFYKEKSEAFASLCQIYIDSNDGPLEFRQTYLFDGKIYMSFVATDRYLVGSSDTRPYLFVYDFITDEFQYVGFYNNYSSLLAVQILRNE